MYNSALPFGMCVQWSEVSSVLEEGLLEVVSMSAGVKNVHQR